MKTWAVTIRTDVRFPEKDYEIMIKAYNEEHVVDILGVYWVLKVELASTNASERDNDYDPT